MNFQKNFLATLWAAGVLILTVEQPPDSEKSLKNGSKILVLVQSAEIGYRNLAVCSSVAV